MSFHSAVVKGLLAVAAGAVMRSNYWKRQAQSFSDADLAAATTAQMEYLLFDAQQRPDKATHVAVFAAEARTPEDGDLRWRWWVAATCPAVIGVIDDEEAEVCRAVHDPMTGWSPSEQAARAAMQECVEYIAHGHADCPVLDALMDEDDEDDDDEPSTP